MMGVISMKIMDTIGFVENVDKEVGEAMEAELARQRRNLELIASENIVSPAVMAGMGSLVSNKDCKLKWVLCLLISMLRDILVRDIMAVVSALTLWRI